MPFYSHEIDAYWNDIGNLEELRQGNLDALRGAVEVEPGAPEVGDGVRSASPLEGVEVEGPVLVGAGVRVRRRRPHPGPGDHRRRLPDRRRRLGARLDPARRHRAAGRGRCWSARSPAASQSPDAFLTACAPRVRRRAARSGRASLLPAFVSELIPTLCAACGRCCRSGAVLCTRCNRRLAEAKPLAVGEPRASTGSGPRPRTKGSLATWSPP